MFTLVRLSGPRKNEKLQFDANRVQIGRAMGNDILFDRKQERVVSNHHAEIRLEDNAYVLYDLQSTHGTYANDQRITRWRLQEGDTIGLAPQMGGPTLRFSQRVPGVNLPLPQTYYPPQGEDTRIQGFTPKNSPPGSPSPHHGTPAPPWSLDAPSHRSAQSNGEETIGLPRDIERTAWTSPLDSSGQGQFEPEIPAPFSAGLDPNPTFPHPPGSIAQPPAAPPSDGEGEPVLSEITSEYRPPARLLQAAKKLPTEPLPRALAIGAQYGGKAKLHLENLYKVIKNRKHTDRKHKDQAPAPGALLDPAAATISFRTRVGSALSGAKALIRRISPTPKPKKMPKAKPKPGKVKKTTVTSTPQTLDPPRKKPEKTRRGPQSHGVQPKPFVLEEAIKEPPREEWTWLINHRWFVRFLLVGLALSWWYGDKLALWFTRLDAEPVPMIEGRSMDGALTEPPGAQNPESVRLIGALYSKTMLHSPEKHTDGSVDLRALRPVLRKAGEDSALVPLDFLDQVSDQIKEKTREPEFEFIYARSLRYRPEITLILAEASVPEIVGVIPWLESNFSPSFKDGRSGRVGLWALDADTARRHGLTVSRTRDDRLDWRLSTKAIASYFIELVGEVRGLSFTLPISAFQKGPLAARALLEHRKGWKKHEVDLWQFYRNRYIPTPMQDYLIEVLAVAAICETPERYQLPPTAD